MQNINARACDELDKEFLMLCHEIEKRSEKLTKHQKLRIESWVRKLNQVTNNKEWKKNRNLHAICIVDMMFNDNLELPYNKFAPEGSIPIISKSLVKSRLSNKFHEFMENIDNFRIDDDTEIIIKETSPMKSIRETASRKIENKLQVSNSNSKSLKNFKDENVLSDTSLDQLRITIENFKNELQLKDDIIIRQNEDRRKLEVRLMELQKIIDSIGNKK